MDGKWYEFDDSKVKPMAEAEVKTSSAYLLFYQRKGVMNSVREDLETGYHWIYKLYPNAFKSVTKNLNRNSNNSQPTENIIDQDIPPHLNSPEHSPLIKVHTPPNRVHTSPAKTQDGTLQRSDSEPSICRNDVKHIKTNSDLETTDYLPDKAWRNDEASDVLVRPSQLKTTQKKADVQREAVFTAKSDINNKKPYDHNKYTEKRREQSSPVKQPLPTENNERKHAVSSGLTVKLPDKEVFIVRQNHKTGQTTYEPFKTHVENHAHLENQAKQRNISHSNGSSTGKQDPEERRISASQNRHVSDHQDDVDVPLGPRSFPPSIPSRIVSTNDNFSPHHGSVWPNKDEPLSPIDYNRQLSNPARSGYVAKEAAKKPQFKRSKSQIRYHELEQNSINDLKSQGKNDLSIVIIRTMQLLIWGFFLKMKGK